MSVTAKEIAVRLGISAAAVSMALNNKPGVSTETRKRVLEAAHEMGFDFSRIHDSSVQSSINGTVHFILYQRHGAVVSDTPFFAQLSEGIHSGCRQHRYFLNVSYIYKEDNIKARLDELIQTGCKGIILLGTEMSEEDFFPFERAPVPLVLLDNYFEYVKRDCVLINNIQGAFQATMFLISRCKAQPGYLQSAYPINNFVERTDGFYKAIRTAGMSTSKSIVHRLAPSVEGAYADMKAILETNEETAKCYFADNDFIACGAAKAFLEKGYRIPEDVAIVGFDNIPLTSYFDPPLTTVNVPKQYMGEMAVKRLADIIDNPSSHPIKVEISTELEKRKSV